METVFLIIFHWGYDGETGVDYCIFKSYDDAYAKLEEIISEEINNQWIGEHLDENGSPLDGYVLDTIARSEDETDLWWNCYEIGRGNENFTYIDLKKVEVK